MSESKAGLQICSPSLSLVAGFLPVRLEENRTRLLHGPEKGQVFVWQDGADGVSLPSSRPGLVRRAPDRSRGFFRGKQSPFYFFFFFFFWSRDFLPGVEGGEAQQGCGSFPFLFPFLFPSPFLFFLNVLTV